MIGNLRPVRWMAPAILGLALVLAGCGDASEESTGVDGGADGEMASSTSSSAPTTTSEAAAGTTSGSTASQGTDNGDDLYPDVIDASAERNSDGTFRFDVTISSPYDSPERYADAWRVVGMDGTVFGIRELAHDHAGEQPFTRSLSGVEIPNDVDVVVIEGRDQVSGWGGATFELTLQR